MKIVAPLTNHNCYEQLVEAGCDEFYFGFIPYSWQKEFINNCIPLNRREYILNACNNFSFDTLKILQKKIEKYKKPVKITFNSHYYNKNQYKVLKELIKRLIDIGFNKLIIGDLSLIIYLQEANIECDIHMSGELMIPSNINVNYYSKFNISRFIFPRKTSVNEIKSIIHKSNLNVEFEAFVLNDICYYSGALCNSFHCDEFGSFCGIPHMTFKNNPNSKMYSNIEKTMTIKNQMLLSMMQQGKLLNKNQTQNEETLRLGQTGCGLCRIKELIDYGVTHGKVVGRGRDLSFLVKSTKVLKEIINLAKEKDINSFIKVIKEEYLENKCSSKCYYPNFN